MIPTPWDDLDAAVTQARVELDEVDLLAWLRTCLATFDLGPASPDGQRLIRQLSVLHDKGLIATDAEQAESLAEVPPACLCGHPEHPDHDTAQPARICATCQREDRHPARCWGFFREGDRAVEVDEHGQVVPDLHQAVRAAAKALLPWADEVEVELFEWHECDQCPTPGQPCACSGQPWPSEPVRAAITAAWGVLTQPLADLQRDLDYTTQPESWDTERAAELDRLAAFEVAIRDALKPWTWSGIDADGRSYRIGLRDGLSDVVDDVGKAVIDLEQSRERPNG